MDISLQFILSLVTALLISWSVQAQPEYSKGAQKAFAKAEDFMQAGDIENAEKSYLKTLDLEAGHTLAQVRLGAMYFDQQDYDDSKKYFGQVMKTHPDDYPLIYFKMGEIAWREQVYQDVIRHMEQYLSYRDGSPKLRKQAEKYLRDSRFIAVQTPTDIPVSKLKGAVNTAAPEYLPAMPVTGEFMVFTRRVRGQEDFYISTLTSDGWSEGLPISDLNTPENEGAHCVSADGKLLIFTACARRDGLGSCDLYFSTRADGKWSHPRNLGSGVNTSAWEGQPSLSSNGLTLYFSSDRKGGKGSRDIWKVERTSSGWSKAKNLADINTTGNDESPFMHWDNETLYFMTDGLPGFGGSDLFLTRLENTGWTTPLNLGSPLNTSGDEGALFIDMPGQTGYFARTNLLSDELDIDIYSFPVPDHLKPLPVTYARVQVVDDQTRLPIQAVIEVYDLQSEKTFIKTYSDRSGELLVCLTSENSYAISVQKEGYSFYSRNIDLSGTHSLLDPYRIEANLIPVSDPQVADSSEAIVLENVFFESGSSALLPESEHELKHLVQLMEDNPDISISIHGHTDNVGSPDDNQVLSLDRSESIKNYLVQSGVGGSRIACKGFGETRPIDTNDTEEGRSRNRRSEFIILKK